MPARGDSGPLWIAVDASRNVSARAGYRIRYLAQYDDQVLGHTSPPRMRIEEAFINLVIASTSPLERIQLLADACASRRTTPSRITDALASRSRVPDRSWLEAVLRDIAEGTCSVLEHGYLTRIERHPDLGQLIELDGRLGHDDAVSRDADLERDLDAALSRRGTVRLGWGQVFGRPCQTASKVGVLLAAGGWTGRPRACGPGCRAGQL